MNFNLNEEIIDGHLVTADIKKLWSVQLDLAKHLLEVCARNNLKIWATDGTLLGAVRHEGFIPWDDDMDFCMMREDYDKLMEIGPKEFEDPYFFQSFYTDEHSWGAVTKIRRSNTAVIEKDYKTRKDFNRGIFIDIFVMDAIPNNRSSFEKKYKKVSFLRRLLKNYEMMNPNYYPMSAKIKHAIISAFFLIVPPRRIHKKIELLLSSDRVCDNEYCSILDYYALEGRDISRVKLRKKVYYDDTDYLPFYDIQMPVPKGYDELLKVIYGDYMKPVKGTQSHTTLIIDFERSYKDVLVELRRNTK